MKQFTMVRFQEDETILRQGCMDRTLYKILSGKAAVYLRHGQSDEYLVGILSEQRCFGEMSLLCGKPNLYTVVSVTEVLVMRITEETFDAFIKSNSQNAIDIMRNLANTVTTLSFNLDQLAAELGSDAPKSDLREAKDITKQIRQYAAADAISKALFALYA